MLWGGTLRGGTLWGGCARYTSGRRALGRICAVRFGADLCGTAIAAVAKKSSFRCPEVGTKFDGQNRPPSRYLHCPADVQHIYLYVDAYIYIIHMRECI